MLLQVRHRANQTDRPLLLSFKGSCAGKPRAKYAAWHNARDVVVLCTDQDKASSAKYNYHELQLRSRFALTPAGNGLHSSRLMEAVFLGAIPVLAEPELLLPFCDVVDWQLFSVRVPPDRWEEIPKLLRAITPERLREMQAHLAAARVAYFENPMRTAISLVWFRLQAHERKTPVALVAADPIREARDGFLGRERLLVQVSGDIADDGMQLSKHAAWHGQTGRPRALDLTVLTSFVLKDAEFVVAWLEDISHQQALHIFVVELVIGCFEEKAHAFVVEAVNRSLDLLGHLARVSVCLFADDPGIYGMWDMIIGREATAPVVTNWNVDDRKSPLSLSRRLNVLNADAHIDAVTSGVLLFNDSRYAWAERNQAHTLRLFDLCSDRLLQIEDMFVIHWNRSDANTEPAPFVHGSQNVPHNSPMWRKAMHHWIGGFSPKDKLGCYDFSFWVRALRRGVRIQHINEPLEMYLARSTSHGHQTHAWESPDWADRWSNECDSRQEWEANRAAVLRAAIGRYAPSWGRCASTTLKS